MVAGLASLVWIWTRQPAAGITAPDPAGDSAAIAALPPAPPKPTTGTLDISSDPPGARVVIDGIARGATPVSLKDIAPGAHEVSILAGNTTISRTVSVEAGTTSTVLASVVPARPGAGWVAVEMPFEAEILENGRLLGTTSSDRLALPAGWHELELRNTGLGFRASLSVQIVPGQVARPGLGTPTGLLSVNAIPWANVTIDGTDHGTTPLANLSVPIGEHQILLKHPRLGERRETVVVMANSLVRVGVTLGQ
jgi:hypothetical protein